MRRCAAAALWTTLAAVLAACPPTTPADPCAARDCPTHSSCRLLSGVASCVCATAYTGVGCDRCDTASGFHPGADATTCTDDPCDPDPCNAALHQACSNGSCGCAAANGYHLAGDGVTCTDDGCDPDPCDAANHELCDDGACPCDAASGYHLGGNGTTCTASACDPNPCNLQNHEVCFSGDCQCDPMGYHLGSDGVTCTTEGCDPNPCSAANHELCSNGDCSCDASNGYHRAGDGTTCTTDACDPDPCSVADHELCNAGNCSCDVVNGFHRGANGHTCTNSPCDPNPCVAADRFCNGGHCESLTADPCDPSLAAPVIEAGLTQFIRDGTPVNLAGGNYSLVFPIDVIAGELTLYCQRDVNGALVPDLIAAGSFPICIPLDGTTDGTTYAFLEDGGVSWATTDTHTGHLAIVAKQGSYLIGRFAFVAQQNSGSALTTVRAGMFNVPAR